MSRLPPGKWRANSSWPVRASEDPRTKLLTGTPSALRVGTKAAPMPNKMTQAIHTPRGCLATNRPVFAYTPVWVCSSSVRSGSKRGIRGQYEARPSRWVRLGSRVSEASIAKATPMAATGPKERLEPRSLNNRHNRPAITVPPEARIGSRTPRKAARVASVLDSWRRSSSRYRAVYSKE